MNLILEPNKKEIISQDKKKLNLLRNPILQDLPWQKLKTLSWKELNSNNLIKINWKTTFWYTILNENERNFKLSFYFIKSWDKIEYTNLIVENSSENESKIINFKNKWIIDELLIDLPEVNELNKAKIVLLKILNKFWLKVKEDLNDIFEEKKEIKSIPLNNLIEETKKETDDYFKELENLIIELYDEKVNNYYSYGNLTNLECLNFKDEFESKLNYNIDENSILKFNKESPLMKEEEKILINLLEKSNWFEKISKLEKENKILSNWFKTFSYKKIFSSDKESPLMMALYTGAFLWTFSGLILSGISLFWIVWSSVLSSSVFYWLVWFVPSLMTSVFSIGVLRELIIDPILSFKERNQKLKIWNEIEELFNWFQGYSFLIEILKFRLEDLKKDYFDTLLSHKIINFLEKDYFSEDEYLKKICIKANSYNSMWLWNFKIKFKEIYEMINSKKQLDFLNILKKEVISFNKDFEQFKEEFEEFPLFLRELADKMIHKEERDKTILLKNILDTFNIKEYENLSLNEIKNQELKYYKLLTEDQNNTIVKNKYEELSKLYKYNLFKTLITIGVYEQIKTSYKSKELLNTMKEMNDLVDQIQKLNRKTHYLLGKKLSDLNFSDLTAAKECIKITNNLLN